MTRGRPSENQRLYGWIRRRRPTGQVVECSRWGKQLFPDPGHDVLPDRARLVPLSASHAANTPGRRRAPLDGGTFLHLRGTPVAPSK